MQYVGGTTLPLHKIINLHRKDKSRFPLFQGQDIDLTDVEIMSSLTTLKTWNRYLSVFITISQMILKIDFIIYKYF